MRGSNVIRTALEWSLCLLLIPAALMSIEYVVVGLTFGYNLWRRDNLLGITMWLAVVLFPAFVAWALSKSFKVESLAATARLALAAWAFVGLWLWDWRAG